MKSHIIAGATDTGKTTFIKNELKHVPNKNVILVYDVEGEYLDFYPYPFHSEIEDFLSKISIVKKAVIVIEEATIFFSNKRGDEFLTRLLIEKKHKGNYFFLVFHSLRTVPRFIYDLSNYITLFKTNDDTGLVYQKFHDNRLYNMVKQAKKSPNPHYHSTLKIY